MIISKKGRFMYVPDHKKSPLGTPYGITSYGITSYGITLQGHGMTSLGKPEQLDTTLTHQACSTMNASDG